MPNTKYIELDVNYNRTDIDEARVIFFLGVRTDRQDTVLESPYGNMSAHKKFQLKAQN